MEKMLALSAMSYGSTATVTASMGCSSCAGYVLAGWAAGITKSLAARQRTGISKTASATEIVQLDFLSKADSTQLSFRAGCNPRIIPTPGTLQELGMLRLSRPFASERPDSLSMT